ncbi:MAG: hypothetical protein QW707_07315 [Candidatus Bathyarchaeia archaeon]
MLAISQLMEANHYRNQFGLFIIYGQQGVGKSVYTILALKELGLDWKNHLYFRPEEFLARVRHAYLTRQKLKALAIDDAGFGLFAYNWNKPFVKAFVKFLNVARTIMSNMILTTPNPSMLVRKITTLDAYFVKVMKDGTPERNTPYLRLAKGYRNIMLPSGQRMVKLHFEDRFKAYLPDDEYREYLEYRYGYVGDSLDELMRSLPSLYTNVSNNTIQEGA